MNDETILYRFQRANLTLAHCLTDAFAGRSLLGLLQSPRAWRLATWDGQDAGPLKLDQVYEARLFCEEGELRWLRDPAATGQGRAGWISELAYTPKGFEPVDSRALETIDGTILSYAKGFPGADVPDDVAGYTIREYIGSASGMAGEDGNMIVVEHRILRVLARTQTGGTQ